MSKKGTTKFQSNLQEKKVAKELNGRQVSGSGSSWSHKGDVRTQGLPDNILCECKTTKEDYYSLKYITWLKIRSEAINDGLRIPLMCIDLENGKTRLAVFEHNAFSHYNDFETYDTDYLVYTYKKSYRIFDMDENCMIDFRMSIPQVKLEVILWENFIKILESGVGNESQHKNEEPKFEQSHSQMGG